MWVLAQSWPQSVSTLPHASRGSSFSGAICFHFLEVFPMAPTLQEQIADWK